MAVLVAESGDGANVKLRAEVLTTERLSLEPLRADDARELAPLLGDSRLYEHIGGPPPGSEEELRERFARQVGGESPDGAAWWLNWVLRARAGGVAVGTFQATVGRGGEAASGADAEGAPAGPVEIAPVGPAELAPVGPAELPPVGPAEPLPGW